MEGGVYTDVHWREWGRVGGDGGVERDGGRNCYVAHGATMETGHGASIQGRGSGRCLEGVWMMVMVSGGLDIRGKGGGGMDDVCGGGDLRVRLVGMDVFAWGKGL